MDRLPGILRRLSEIEAAIGVLDYLSIRRMVVETQDHILEMQREMLESSRLTSARTPILVKSGPPEIEP